MTKLLAAQRTAIVYLDGVSRGLLRSQNTDLPDADRQEAARKAWSSWERACKAMADLEALMPRSVQTGYDRNAEIDEWRERNPKENDIG